MKQTHFVVAAVMVCLMARPLEARANTSNLVQSSDFEMRDGAAEARVDLRQFHPLKLYSHVFNGRAPGFRTPGLRYCDPASSNSRIFVLVDEAYWQEGNEYSEQHERLALAAIRFANDYNRTIFNARRAEISELCPRVTEAPANQQF